MPSDIPTLRGKLSKGEILPQNDILDLLQDLEHFQGGLAYLASCQAATLERLPKAASKSSRDRHVRLCQLAADLLAGNASGLRFPPSVAAASERCLQAAEMAAKIEAARKPSR